MTLKKLAKHSLTICGIGAAVAFAGEMLGAEEDGTPGGTISEWYRDLPDWIKHLISWCFGAVCAHLWQWRISDAVTVKDVTGDVNIEVEEAQ